MHFGGGNRYSFRELKPHLHPALEMVSLELPGHGNRLKEPLLTSLEAMADDAYEQMKPHLTGDAPFLMYGHSIGAMVMHLVARKLHALGQKLPERLLLTGSRAPHGLGLKRVIYHQLTDQDFKKELILLGGVPQAVIESEELMEFFLPIIRADFQAMETYQYSKVDPLPIPYLVVGGKDEEISLESLQGWKSETQLPLEVHQLPGDHFFIFDQYPKIAQWLNERVKVPSYYA